MWLKKYIKKNSLLFRLLSNVKNYERNKQIKNYENIFSNVEGGNIVVNLKNISGCYEIDARSHILQRILLTKEYEPKIVNLILKSIDFSKDAINIGANIGLYANLLAENLNTDRKVLAIEPALSAFKLLNNNSKRNNNEEKIIAFNGIATNMNGEYKINVIEGKEEYSSVGALIHNSIKNEKYTEQKVKGVTIDYLVNKHSIEPGLIVIDVEGAELNVLRGAIDTLKNYRPIIISEVDDNLLSEQNSNSKEVINFLKDLNYEVLDTENNIPSYPFSGNIIAKG